METTNTNTENVAALAQDLKNAVLTVSILVNIFALVTWLTLTIG